MSLTMGELFAGIGGFSVGFHRAGFETRWAVEWDRDCQRVLRHHWPGLEIHGDIRDVKGRPYAENDRIEAYSVNAGAVLPTPPGTAAEGLVPMRYQSNPARLGFHYKKLTPEKADEAVALYDSGLSIGAVAEHFGVSRQGMHDILKRRTTMRPQLRYGDDNHFYRGGVTADPEAHDALEGALRRGEIVRPDTCEVCGEAPPYSDGRHPINAHHDDYNQPLAVRWLCQPCHHEWHKHNTAKRKEVQGELEPVDVITAGFP